jgi:hypothetical protein
VATAGPESFAKARGSTTSGIGAVWSQPELEALKLHAKVVAQWFNGCTMPRSSMERDEINKENVGCGCEAPCNNAAVNWNHHPLRLQNIDLCIYNYTAMYSHIVMFMFIHNHIYI